MNLERIESEGLAHYSYFIGSKGEAIVIDPRRDCDIYIEKATQNNLRITHILETHRNEDYVIGSVELASRTGAEIWHADSEWDYAYGQPAGDGQTWGIGTLKIEAMHTPGHTTGSMSYLLHDSGGTPWMVFCGDTLFAGDVGRVDLLGHDRLEEMAGLLHETIFRKLLPLGDGVIVCPAHGPGSVCGGDIADRTWTSIGLERKLNPKLQVPDRDRFIEKIARPLEFPPYFRRVEELNVKGPALLGTLPSPPPLSPALFSEKVSSGIVVDTRMALGFGAAHVPGALSLWEAGLPSFAGWFLPYNQPLLLVNGGTDPTESVRSLIRLGYDDIVGTLAGGMHAWHTAGKESRSIAAITVQETCKRLDTTKNIWILDVRGADELEREGRIHGAHHIHITQLPSQLDAVPRDRPVLIFCGSGLRSMLAGSFLQREGWSELAVVSGGFSGWSSISCPLES